jgi:DNA-binding response OmpR family regulator
MKVLVVEDSTETQAFLGAILKSLGVEIHFAATLDQARTNLETSKPDLILLDMNLPDGTGLEFCESMLTKESWRSIPFIFISGDEEVSSKVTAFTMGAEDYIVKPFNVMELKARLDARIKKIASQQSNQIALIRGALHIDIAKQQVRATIGQTTTLISLTPREFQILSHLAQKEDHVFSRDQLLVSVWGNDSEVFDRTVDTHVSAIRKKLGDLSYYIESVPGSGYRFTSTAKPKKQAA